jgi:phenylacetate-CoA ligase
MGLEDLLYGCRGLYEKAPAPLRALAGRAYRALPAGLRFGRRYGSFCGEARASEDWDEAQVREYQQVQLQETVRAAAQAPFHLLRMMEAGIDPWKVASVEDLARLPPVTKADLILAGEDAATPLAGGGAALPLATGGSTGEPLRFYLERHVSRAKEQAYLERQWSRTGYRSGDKTVVLRGQVTTKGSRGRMWYHDPARNWLVMSSWHLTAENLPVYLGEIRKFAPVFLHAYPSSARLLSAAWEAEGMRGKVPLKGVLCGSEELGLAGKRELEKVYGARVYRWYGHSERAVLAGEGRDSERFYFWPGYGLVEWGPEDAQGFREIIATGFHNAAYPFLRYRTGDYARVAPPDGAEFPWQSAEVIRGRGEEFLVGAGGRKVSLTALNRHDDLFRGLLSVQFHQEEEGEVEMRYVKAADHPEESVREVLEEIRALLGDDFCVTMRAVNDVEKRANGKARWITGVFAEGGGDS